MRSKLRRRTLLITAALSVAACGGDASTDNAKPNAPANSGGDLAALIERYRATLDSSRFGAESVADALPNTRFERPDPSQSGPLYTHVVVGHVVEVRPGEGFYREPPADDPADHVRGREVRTSFDDPRAEWRTVVATLSVSSHLGRTTGRSLELAWPIAGPTNPYPDADPTDDAEDPDATAAALKELGDAVWFLRPDPQRGGDSPLVVPDVAQGLIDVDDATGELSMPFYDDGARFLGSIRYLRDLEVEAGKPERTKQSRV